MKNIENILEVLKKIQEKRKNPILFLQLETIDIASLLKTHKLLHRKAFNTLDVILNTPGGDIDAAFQYTKILRKKSKKINILVPLFSKSAGTLMCLCGDKIFLTDLSELGPLDTQIQESQEGDVPSYSSALNGFKALEQVQRHSLETLDIAAKLIYNRSKLKMSEAVHLAIEFSGQTVGTLYGKLNPLKIGEYARALEIGEKYGIMILTDYMNWDFKRAQDTIKKLVYDYPSHAFVIDFKELQSIGLPAEEVGTDIEEHMFELRDVIINVIKSRNTIIHLIEQENRENNHKKNKRN